MLRLVRRFWRVTRLAVIFLGDLTVSGCRVAIAAFGPTANLRGEVFDLPLDVRADVPITLFANLISLTPGTLVLDVADDRSALVVHTMFAEETGRVREDIKAGLENRIREIWE